jgi:phenylpyruvate tautomerase PptA (4-oxalocrotonate tautomerase family)
MPFIDSKLTLKVSDDKKETIKSKLGEAISIIGKPESFLMVGFEDEYDLFMAGKKLEKGAYVAVRLFGNASSDAYDKMTSAICNIYEEELGIPSNNVYVSYIGTNDWGWSGRNF